MSLTVGNFVSFANAETLMAELAAAINAAKTFSWADVAFGGRNLLGVLNVSTVSQAAAALKTKSDAKDYSGLRLGDYLDITSSYGEYGTLTVRYEIASMGQYHWFWSGSESVYDLGNIVFLATVAPFSRRIGTSTAQKGYFTSPMNTFLTGTVAPALENALGVTLKRPVLYQNYNDATYDSPDWYTDPNNWDDDDSEQYASPKVYLPSIREFFGTAEHGCPYMDNSHQFPLFTVRPNLIPVKNTSGVYTWSWSRTPSLYPGDFCSISGSGDSISNYANGTFGVRPAFCL